MGATIEANNNPKIQYDEYEQPIERDAKTLSYEKYAVVCSIITFVVTLIIVIIHLSGVLSMFFVGTKIEGFMCFILAGLWAGIVAIVSNPRHGIAIDELNGITNGNIYYFSWAGFICSITLLVSYLRSAFSVDLAGEIKNRSARLQYWSLYLAASLVVMGSSANIFDEDCSSGIQSKSYCRRTKFGIAMGAAGTVMSLVIVAMKIATAKAPFLIEALFAFLLMVCGGFEVAFVTSHQGPGAPLGNLYYFSWIAFLSTFMLFASCLEDYNAAKAMNTGNEPTDSEIQVEDLDDTI
eukprot:CAMPEP_0113544894 /NCGR_PEP_ID=MMETSP0015_2-20120614/10956_1 /TAXON_ID=2838 /ORGANISM="Odontella" /LENGTH=293 /DNA_ID=CAMNT_0000445193 /DNA_START=364 /DNA_END=1245 /DNA_ORIENTATION=+ /assembly_acc=CAM_ASM_000160